MKSALIIAGSKTQEVAGKAVKQLLEDEKIEVETLIVQGATLGDVEAVEERIKVFRPQIVLGVGGGTKIDVAKCSSARQGTPFISIPTTASHDGIASPLSSIKGFDRPFSVMSQAPIAIIADTDIIMQAPWRFTVSGCGDVVSKLTAVRDWRLAHEEKGEYYGIYAASLALMSAKHVMENVDLIRKKSEEGIRVLIEALISCGVAMSIAGTSRPCSGSEHMFGHALELVRPDHSLHGERCGIGTIMMSYLHKLNWMRVRNTFEKLNAPTCARELDVDKEDVIEALKTASTIRPERYTVLDKLNLSSDSCEKLIEATGVG